MLYTVLGAAAAPEHTDAARDMRGVLRRHMYGTQRAADGWQSECSGSLVELGFSQGIASPCVFRHAERHIMVSVHGDDFTCSGARPDLQWLETALREKYELTVGARLGPGGEDTSCLM